MNPGLVIKLRPSGPWRIGPDSGARNRVDFIYHSDSLYSAVASAMARLGSLDAWLDATARAESPQVWFSSCFPFLDEIGFIIPPRTVWPPSARSLVSARVRWKSARFVPLGVVQAVLSGQQLDDNHWTVDGPSECLVPTGRPGPFRTSVRWSAAVDRLTGSAERHSTACLEFRPGAGLWMIVSFLDSAAQTRWVEPVKAAFRLLADTGFGGERSRGWGRAETPEFIDGILPDMILPPLKAAPAPESESPSTEAPEPVPVTEPPSEAPAVEEPPADPSEPVEAEAEVTASSQIEALTLPPTEPEPPAEELQIAPTSEPPSPGEPEPPLSSSPAPTEEPAAVEEPVTSQPPTPIPQPVASESEPAVSSTHAPAPGIAPHWLLSLFTPSGTDAVDWRRGNYTVLARGGRIDSPAGSGELKKQVQMIAEGSVVYAPSGPCGAAADVAPDGFPHPVFRAGFALSIPLPEVS
jgi:CRISPR type III-A-associated RAMP protein Csm4